MFKFLSNKKGINELQKELSILEEKFEISKIFLDLILELNNSNEEDCLKYIKQNKEFNKNILKRIKELKEDKNYGFNSKILKFLSNKKGINELQKELSILEEKFEIIKFSLKSILELKSILKLNDSNEEYYLNILNKIEEFNIVERIKEFKEDKSFDLNKISENLKNLKNLKKGKDGEKKFEEILIDLKEDFVFEYIYNFNIKYENKESVDSRQFDFLLVNNNNIYIIEVKNLKNEEIIFKKDENNEYIFELDGNESSQSKKEINKIKERYKLIKDTLGDNYYNEAEKKYIFNILFFVNEMDIKVIDNKFSNKPEPMNKREEFFEAINIGENIKLQALSGVNEMKRYFSRFFRKDEGERENISKRANAIKNDINFVEKSTDKIYISRDIMKFFDELFKTLN